MESCGLITVIFQCLKLVFLCFKNLFVSYDIGLIVSWLLVFKLLAHLFSGWFRGGFFLLL